VFVIFVGNFGKVSESGPVFFHVFPTSISKHLRSERGRFYTICVAYDLNVLLHGTRSICVLKMEKWTKFEMSSFHLVAKLNLVSVRQMETFLGENHSVQVTKRRHAPLIILMLLSPNWKDVQRAKPLKKI
jgi:hypothetical protein